MSEDVMVGEWTVQPLRGLLQNDNTVRHIQPKAMDVLMCLIEHAPDVIERDMLLEKVWGANSVSDEPLTRCIGELRKALGDKRSEPRFIETIPKRGYRLLVTPSHSVSDQQAKEIVTASSIPEYSIAVLPFIDLSEESDQKHLAEGIADEILTNLTQISEMKVAARTSSFSLFDKDLDTIRNTLGVRFVLEGSVKKYEGYTKVNARMTDTNDGFQVFALSNPRNNQDLLQIQDDIVRGVLDAIPSSLVVKSYELSSTKKMPDVEVYNLYLKGRSAFYVRNMEEAVDYLQQACDRGGNFASLYATYAAVLSLIPTYHLTNDRPSTYEKTREYAQKALALEPDSSLALSTLGLVCLVHRQWQLATEYLQEAVTKNPREATARQWYGSLHLSMGDTKNAMEQYAIAREIDPISPPLLRDIAVSQYFNRQPDKAEETLLLAESLISGHSQAYIINFMGLMFLDIGKHDKALQAMRRDVFLSHF